MSNFIQLVKNEHIKIYARKSTWVMFAIVAAIVILGAIIITFTESNGSEYGNEWRQELQGENERLIQEMEEDEIRQGLNQPQIAKNNYYLENDIKPQSYDAWQFVMENASLAPVLSLFTIIIAAGIIAHEFKWGTIKLLLIRPVSRLKVLLSKYVTVLLLGLVFLVFLLVLSWIVGALIFGVNGLNPAIVQQQVEGYAQVNVLQKISEGYGSQFVNLIMMTTFAFMVAVLFRNSGMTIGISIFLLFAGGMVINFLSQYSWTKYILFTNLNLAQQYAAGREPVMEGMSLTFSVIVLAVYYSIFLLASLVAFTKRDVAGQ